MKLFNQVIQIEISVDAIADQLLSVVDPKFKHKEVVVEAIIGNLLKDDMGLGQLYNTLNGYSIGVNFEVGDVITCFKLIWCYEKKDGKVIELREHIGECKVIAINPYVSDRLKVTYVKMDSNGTLTHQTCWVAHTKCEKVFNKIKAKK